MIESALSVRTGRSFLRHDLPTESLSIFLSFPPQPQLLLLFREIPFRPGTYEYCVLVWPLQSETVVITL